MPQSLSLLLRGQFAFMDQHGFEVWTCSADGKEVKDVLSEGARHRSIPFTRKITPWADLIALISLAGLIRKVKPAIVHTHTPKAGLLGMMAARFCGVPVRLHTIAGLPLMEKKGLTRQLLVVTEKITYACAHRVFPNSKGMMNFINEKVSRQNKKLKLIGNGSSNGIDVSVYSRTPEREAQARELRLKLSIPMDAIVFSFVGRLVSDKGIVELVDAFQHLNLSNAWLLLVGPEEPSLDPLPESTKRILKSNSRILTPGFQADVRPWLLASDIFVFPSHREGFPNAVMQAACLEVPCIVSDINGNNEIIQSRESGIVVPVRNVASLCQAMQQLAVDGSLRKQFGTQSRLFVRSHFDQQLVWSELLKEYTTLLSNTGDH